MSVKAPENNTEFLAGGGEMGELTRNYDWSQTSIGTPDQWPQSLRTTLSIILNSNFPMFLFWSSELLCFYNDAYRPSLGNNGKHPGALGKPGEEIWPEIWGDIKPLIDQVMSGGGSTWSEDQLLPIYRNNRLEDVYWTFSYSPVIDESGRPAGIFVTCTETTEKVKTLSHLRASEHRFRTLINEATMATAVFTGENLILELANDVTLNTWGKDRSVIGKPLLDFLPEFRDQPFPDLLRKVYQTGEAQSSKEAVVHIKKHDRIESHYTDFNFKPLRDENDKITGVLTTAMDVTDKVIIRKKLEESNDELQFAIEATELGTFDYNPFTNRFSANDRLKDWFGLPANSDIALTDAINVMAEKDRERVTSAIQKALDYNYGGGYDIEYSIIHPFTQKETIVRAKGRAWFNEDHLAYRFNGTLQDVTEQVNARKKTEESERNIRLIILQAPVAIAIFRGPDYTVEIANEKALELWGRTADEITGKPLLEAMPELQRQGIKELLDDVYTTGVPFSANELPVSLVRNGIPEKVYVNFAYEPLYGADGAVNGILTVSIEVTEQVLSHHKIEESELRVRLLVESAPFPIGVYVGREMRVEVANQAIVDVWGKGNDVVGRLFSEILPELENQEIFKQLDKVFTTGISFHTRNQYLELTKDGMAIPYYFNYSLTPLFDAFGHVYGVMNTAANVTDLNIAKQKTEDVVEQLSKTTQRLQLALEAGNLGSYELNMATGIITCTPQCKINYGRPDQENFTHSEMIGMIVPEDRENRERHMKYAIEHKKVYDIEYRITWPDGSVHWIHAAGMPVYDDNGTVQQIIGVTTDVTKQKLFEQELSRQVQERTRELEQKNIELEKMNEELKSFAYVSSHDLQEPLRKIQTFSDRILEKEQHNLSDTGKDYFIRMQNAARRMQTLIEDLLTYSRTNSAERVFKVTDLRQVVKDVRDDFKDMLLAKQATIISEQMCEASIIPFQFRQLMQNLISNALKFSAPGRAPVIEIKSEIINGSSILHPKLSDYKSYCHISVKDNGIGFEPEYSEKIFEVFQRLHSVSEYQGTGIGLAIVKKIIDNHEGVITATGELDKGATFDIYIPA